MQRIRGKTQRAIAWVLVIVTGVFIPGLTITTHVCYARNIHEIWLVSTNELCCEQDAHLPKENPVIDENSPITCCASIKSVSFKENAGKTKEFFLLNAQANKDAFSKIQSAKKTKHCCEKDVKVFQIKDSFLKSKYKKDLTDAPLLLLAPGLYFVFPPETAALKLSTANVPPLPYGKTLRYLYQTLLN